jgi:hypothetical protein
MRYSDPLREMTEVLKTSGSLGEGATNIAQEIIQSKLSYNINTNKNNQT